MSDRQMQPLRAAIRATALAVSALLTALDATTEGAEQNGVPDEMIGAKEAAKRTGMSTRWLYLHADELPFAHRTSARAVRYSARGIERWNARKKTLTTTNP